MSERELQVTYRRGRIFAAYLYLSHDPEQKSARTVASADHLLIVDYDETGKPLGVEITYPPHLSLERLNQLLVEIGEAPLGEQEFKPLQAA